MGTLFKEEKVNTLRKDIWRIPPVVTTTTDIKITHTTTQAGPLTRLIIRRGISFCTVESRKILAQEDDNTTLKNHMWHGARPSFTTIERMINTLTLTFRNRSASTEEKKITMTPQLGLRNT